MELLTIQYEFRVRRCGSHLQAPMHMQEKWNIEFLADVMEDIAQMRNIADEHQRRVVRAGLWQHVVADACAAGAKCLKLRKRTRQDV